MENITITLEFEGIRRITQQGAEWWSARDLQIPLGYAKWQNFSYVISKAIVACKSSGLPAQDHFTDISNMILAGKGAQRRVSDFMLTRHACYLIAMNGDASHPQIAAAQTYFAIQTSKQEANITHREVGKKVRKAISDIGGTMPENLPTEQSIKKVQLNLKKRIGLEDPAAR